MPTSVELLKNLACRSQGGPPRKDLQENLRIKLFSAFSCVYQHISNYQN